MFAVDTTPPAITLPATPAATEATGSSGATVTYGQATEVDIVDGPVTPTCTPGSGTVFEVGTTAVTCYAQDTAGNVAISTFDVVVGE